MAKTRTVTESYPRGQRSASGASVPGLAIPDHDDIEMTYSGTNLTGVKYFTRVDKGTSKVLRAELVLTYDGSNNLVSVTKVDI